MATKDVIFHENAADEDQKVVGCCESNEISEDAATFQTRKRPRLSVMIPLRNLGDLCTRINMPWTPSSASTIAPTSTRVSVSPSPSFMEGKQSIKRLLPRLNMILRAVPLCWNQLLICILNMCKGITGHMPKVVSIDIVEMALWTKYNLRQASRALNQGKAMILASVAEPKKEHGQELIDKLAVGMEELQRIVEDRNRDAIALKQKELLQYVGGILIRTSVSKMPLSVRRFFPMISMYTTVSLIFVEYLRWPKNSIRKKDLSLHHIIGLEALPVCLASIVMLTLPRTNCSHL